MTASNDGSPFQVNDERIDRVLRGGAALSSAPSGPESQAFVAAPLDVHSRRIGVLYLEARRSGTRFDERDLEIVTRLAAIAAVAIENARQVEWLAVERRRLETELDIERPMLGESAPMREVQQRIARAAPTDSTVLIGGESGTGKELAARAIHRNSRRAEKPFVAINCAALTESLLESELFGHEKGAFTGAVAQKKGRLEAADGGTLFLDEVGELTPAIQTKLLRVLQEHEFERVGGTRPVRVDVRVIAATNRQLEAAVREGAFRQDLFYRLNVVRLVMPPLRERRQDIPLLAAYFVEKHADRCSRRILGIAPETRARLLAYDWPGNVRELENAIECAVVLGAADMIMPEDLPESILDARSAEGPFASGYRDAVQHAKRQVVLKAFEQAEGNHTAAAELLGIHPNNLHRLLRSLELRPAKKDAKPAPSGVRP